MVISRAAPVLWCGSGGRNTGGFYALLASLFAGGETDAGDIGLGVVDRIEAPVASRATFITDSSGVSTATDNFLPPLRLGQPPDS